MGNQPKTSAATGAPAGLAPAPGSDAEVIRRSFRLILRRTSIALHRREWALVEEMAERQGRTVKQFLLGVEASQPETSLPSAIRLTLLAYWRDPAVYEGRVVHFPKTATIPQDGSVYRSRSSRSQSGARK